MHVNALDILQNALLAAEAAGIARKSMCDGSAADLMRVNRLINGEVDRVDYTAAVNITNCIPAPHRDAVIQGNHPWLSVPAKAHKGGVAGLMPSAAVVLGSTTQIISATTAFIADGRISANERTALKARIQQARADLDSLEATLDTITTPPPARRR